MPFLAQAAPPASKQIVSQVPSAFRLAGAMAAGNDGEQFERMDGKVDNIWYTVVYFFFTTFISGYTGRAFPDGGRSAWHQGGRSLVGDVFALSAPLAGGGSRGPQLPPVAGAVLWTYPHH